MQYCRFQTPNGPQYGEVVSRNGEFWVERILPPPPEDLSVRPYSGSFLAQPLAALSLIAPITPSKIICVGLNYSDHVAEMGHEVPRQPVLFFKPPSSLLAPGGTIRLPALSRQVDFEGELGVVIGRTCHQLRPDEDAHAYIRGYTLVNDVTARDLQRTDGQWTRAKGFDTFCPVGPIVSDEVDPQGGLCLTTRLNGVQKQASSTANLIFSIPILLQYISSIMTLYPGDLISTGTPSGVGPMQPGDDVAISIEGLGTLANHVDTEPA